MAGGLMSHGTSLRAAYRQVAISVRRQLGAMGSGRPSEPRRRRSPSLAGPGAATRRKRHGFVHMPTAIPPGMLEYYQIGLSTNGLLLQARQQVPLRQPFHEGAKHHRRFLGALRGYRSA